MAGFKHCKQTDVLPSGDVWHLAQPNPQSKNKILKVWVYGV